MLPCGRSELQHINCGQFTELLLSKGFADKVNASDAHALLYLP